jgi:hypothetical protein
MVVRDLKTEPASKTGGDQFTENRENRSVFSLKLKIQILRTKTG